MAWLRLGDNSATHPLVLGLSVDEDVRLAAWGFLVQVATLSAQHCTDYVVTAQQCQLAAPTGWQRHVTVLTKGGLLTKIARRTAWRIIDNAPDLIHMRSREEVDRDRMRGRDRRNPDLVCPTLLRDGDQCRWCGRTVNWNDHRSLRSGQFDHLDPGTPTRVDTWVVSCKGCNTRRGNPDDLEAQEWILRPRPARPLYGPATTERLDEHYGAAKWPAAEAIPDPPGHRSATPQPAGPRAPRPERLQLPDEGSAPADTASSSTFAGAKVTERPQPGSTPVAGSDGRVGSGRVGTGLVGSGPRSTSPPGSRRRRGKRGSGRGAGS